MATLPPCPMCGTNKHSSPHGREEYFCSKHGIYDADPDEGGTHGNNPAARIEREERQKLKARTSQDQPYWKRKRR